LVKLKKDKGLPNLFLQQLIMVQQDTHNCMADFLLTSCHLKDMLISWPDFWPFDWTRQLPKINHNNR